MVDNNAEQQLLRLLDKKVFDPTIRKKPDEYSQEEKRELAEVQKTARSTKDSYHRYGSAEKIKAMFEDDLRSQYGKRESAALEKLGLPTFPELKDEFERLVQKLGVR